VADLAEFRRLYQWVHWANEETLTSLRLTASPAGVRWLAHIAAAELLWLARLRNRPPPLPVWPEFDLDDTARRLGESRRVWTIHLDGLGPDDLDDAVGYRNSKGEFWTSRVSDILTHVSHHGAHHRGQIASAVRAAGGEPAYTDFIHAVRQGAIG
jgi:uncharacterized damage-inducible protein DinB